MTITEDEFSAWRELPITRAFLEKLQRIKGVTEKQWMQSMGVPVERLPIVAAECRVRLEFITLIQTMKAKDLSTDATRNSPDLKERSIYQNIRPERKGPGY
jgi:hypothetical protein